MTDPAQQIRADALKLAAGERLELAYELLSSVPESDPAESRSDAEWIAEIERRAQAAIDGERGLSWPEVRDDIERHLRRGR